ncbi:MAG: hypothetical protein AAF552_16505 [Pseudomonadota bacterium]
MTPEDKARAAAEQVAAIGMPEAGQEPSFLPHPLMDAMMESVLALGGELWIERDRRRTLEALLQDKGLVTADEIESYQLTPEQRESRDQALAEMTKRVFESLKKIGAASA